MSIKAILYTLFVRFWFAIIIALAFIPTMILVFCVPQKYRYNKLFFLASRLLYRSVLWASTLPITIDGKEHIPKDPAIFVANHSSSYDIAMLGSLIGSHPHVWLAMKWLTNFFVFRHLLPRVSVIVDMSSPAKGGRALIKTINLVKQHDMHVMIFPEGRRYTDGNVHKFYGGFTLLAKKTGLPIIPVRMFNLEKAYPPDRFWMERLPIKVNIGEPMHIKDGETDAEFNDRVYRWFIQQEQ